MCGISGIYNLNKNLVSMENLKRFTNSMIHRGPDGAGYEILDRGYLGLGQRRLSILDLSESGKQPMSYGDGRYWITYNGEIFNFLEIRKELEGLGHNFKSESDTEVIIAAYAEWGVACLDKFNGMWAFAIWDEVEKILFMARDRFGIKPLYYVGKRGEYIAFASETRAFKFLDGFKREIDEELLRINLQDTYSLEGQGYTPFKELLQLLPGHFMLVSMEKGQMQQKRWWHIEDHLYSNVPQSFEAQATKFYEIFRDACRIRLISDVPVATALSGGLDSSAVYSVVFDILQKENLGRISPDSQKAFSAIFPGLPQDEKEYADAAAKFVGSHVHYIETEYRNLAQTIERETELCDFISTSPISSISSIYNGMRANGISVSLDGHGVDEMLYGYRDMVYGLYNDSLSEGTVIGSKNFSKVLSNMYHHQIRTEQIAKFSKQIKEKEAREKTLIYKIKKLIKPMDQFRDYLPVKLPSLSDRPYDFSKKPMPERMLYYEFFQHSLPALLRNFDRASMINSTEIRMPFMDWRLVTYAFSLPTSSKIGKGFTKRVLREAMKGKMDEEVRTRTFKVGINSPVEYWFNDILKEWVLDTVKNSQQKEELLKAYKNGGLSTKLVRDTWLKFNVDLIGK